MGTAERANPFARKTDVILPPEAFDRFGHALVAGDVVVVPPPDNPLWEVEAVRPNMDPREPPNLVEVCLVHRYRLRLPARRNVPQVMRVRTAEEMGRPSAPRFEELVPPAVAPWWRRALARATQLVPTRRRGPLA